MASDEVAAAEAMIAAKKTLSGLGLVEEQVELVSAKPALCASVKLVVAASGLELPTEKAVGMLLFELASKVSGKPALTAAIAAHVGSGAVENKTKLAAAIRFAKKAKEDVVDEEALAEAAGVGVVATEDAVRDAVRGVLDGVKEDILEERYQYNSGRLMPKLRVGAAKWADGSVLRNVLNSELESMLGPKTEADIAAASAGKKKKKKAKKGTKMSKAERRAAEEEAARKEAEEEREALVARVLASAVNSEELLKQHAGVTGGVARLRFPPEPNGYLHIGHAKSMHFNFKGAPELLGVDSVCYLRFDDTNPDAESQEFIDNIIENVTWMGWKPWKITYSSEYFDQLHDFAIQLIKMGKAYVCHQSSEEIKASRAIARARDGRDPESPYRNRSVEENLELFENMRLGKYGEGEACLRMKIDMHHPNPCMWDPVAYRIKFTPHPHVGDRWCIYPSYDFTHCLVDSLEHIDYSLCTLEFEVRRDSYYWLLEALDLWRPRVWEFARLAITNTVLSKRTIKRLATEGTVRGWDDPRLFTLNGLRRRGYTPEGINALCAAVGVTRNDSLIALETLQVHQRRALDSEARRVMGVLDPLEVIITNFEEGKEEALSAPDFPARGDDSPRHPIFFSRRIFIDRDSFRLEDDPDFYGLAPGKTVGLRWAFAITCTEVHTDDDGNVTSLSATYDPAVPPALKGIKFIHWVGGLEPKRAEVRIYDHIFKSADPPKDYTDDDLTPDSERVIEAYVDAGCSDLDSLDKLQLERVGYFCVDPDTTADRLVLNQTLPLRAKRKEKALGGR